MEASYHSHRDSEFLGIGWILYEVNIWFLFLGSPSCTVDEEGEAFVWTNACNQSFQTPKERLTMTPVLSQLDDYLDFVTYSDAFNIGLGCILM